MSLWAFRYTAFKMWHTFNSRIAAIQYVLNAKTRKTHLPDFSDLIESMLQTLMKSVQDQITQVLILCQGSLKLFSRHSGKIKLS